MLDAVINLFLIKTGPVLEDFPDDEPENDAITVLSCPVRYNNDEAEDTDTDPLLKSFKREMAAMRPWYDTALNKRKRTTVGVSGIKLEELPDFLWAFIKGETPGYARKDYAPSYMLKLAAEDLKSYYIEAVTAQPGQDWFWDETEAGKALLALKKVCEASPDRMMSMIGAHFLVPGDVARRRG